jgi:hypothetical protein
VPLIWQERGISFYVVCENDLYDFEDPDKTVGQDRWFNFCARWMIRANTTQAFHWEEK